MLKFYRFVGRLCFPHAQTWEQVRSARTMTLVILCSLVLALAVAGLLKLLSSPYLLKE